MMILSLFGHLIVKPIIYISKSTILDFIDSCVIYHYSRTNNLVHIEIYFLDPPRLLNLGTLSIFKIGLNGCL